MAMMSAKGIGWLFCVRDCMVWTQTSQRSVVLWFHLCLNNANAMLWRTESGESQEENILIIWTRRHCELLGFHNFLNEEREAKICICHAVITITHWIWEK